MELMQTMLLSMCGGSMHWMLTASWVGAVVCAVLALFHFGRVVTLGRSIDLPAEICHVYMGLSMAYMFAPLPAIKVIPDIAWALSFSVLALGFALRAAMAERPKLLADASHAVMNLSMVYMFMQSSFDSVVLTWSFIAFFVAYATVHGAELLPSLKNRFSTGCHTVQGGSVFSPVSHVLMSAAMIFMFLMPAMMPSGGGHDHHQHHQHHSAPSVVEPAKPAVPQQQEQHQPHQHQHHHHSH